jgi:hypothetical protein
LSAKLVTGGVGRTRVRGQSCKLTGSIVLHLQARLSSPMNADPRAPRKDCDV